MDLYISFISCSEFIDNYLLLLVIFLTLIFIAYKISFRTNDEHRQYLMSLENEEYWKKKRQKQLRSLLRVSIANSVCYSNFISDVSYCYKSNKIYLVLSLTHPANSFIIVSIGINNGCMTKPI